MPCLGGRRLHLVLILTKYLLTDSSFFFRVRTPFDPDNFVISLRLPNRNTMIFPDGAPTHQSIGVTGAPCREVNSKVATALNTQSRR